MPVGVLVARICQLERKFTVLPKWKREHWHQKTRTLSCLSGASRLGKVFIRAGCVQGQRRAREAVSDLDVVLVVDQRIRSPSGTLGSANAGRGHWPVPFLAVNCARNHVRVDRRRRALVLQALDVVFDGPGCPIDREELRYGNLWLRWVV